MSIRPIRAVFAIIVLILILASCVTKRQATPDQQMELVETHLAVQSGAAPHASGGPPVFIRPGPVTIRAEGSRVVLLKDLADPNDDVVIDRDRYGKPFPPELDLAYALDNARPNDVIGLAPGFHRAMVGYGDPNKGDVASWPAFAVIRDVTITSINPLQRARLNIVIAGDVTKQNQGGIDNLTISGVTIYNRQSDKYGILVSLGSTQGLLRIQDCDTESQDPTAWGDGGVMSWIRTHGWCQVIIYKVVFTKAKEWLCYIDAPQGDSIISDIVGTVAPGRGICQLVERKDPGGYGGYGSYTGITRPSIGQMIIRNVKGFADSFGGGGSAITVAGHSGGPVYVYNIEITGSTGAFVAWSDSSKGLYKNANGFTCPELSLGDFKATFNPGDRDIIQISGCERATINLERKNDGTPKTIFKGNRTAIYLDSQYGGPVHNGTVGFFCPQGTVSAYPGWQAGVKVKKQGITLTNAQLDAMRVAAPSMP